MAIDHSQLFHEALSKVHDIAKNGCRNTQAWHDVLEVVDGALDEARKLDRQVEQNVPSRQLLRLQERYAPHPMETAPRDGTRILAYLYSDPDDDGYKGFGEWREIWWKPYTSLGMAMPWHAGDPHDSHTHGEAPEHFGEGVPVAWMPIPRRPR